MTNLKYIREVLNDFQRSDAGVSDQFLDMLLDLEEIRHSEKKIDTKKLKDSFGFEQYIYEATPYAYIRDFLNFLKPKEGDTVYDLGAGYGRIVIYSALVSKAKFKGIEIVKERVDKANETIKKLKISNAEMLFGNAASFDLSDGNIFFLFNPFYPETLKRVSDQIRDIAKNKEITIVTWGGSSNDFFDEEKWLRDITPKDSLIKNAFSASALQFFKSRH